MNIPKLALLILLVPQVAIAIPVAHEWYYHDFPNGVPGHYSDAQDVCDARALRWDNPLTFIPGQIQGNKCDRYVGSCLDTTINFSLAFPQITFSCPDSFSEGGSSCGTAVCVRDDTVADKAKSKGPPGCSVTNPVDGSGGSNPINIGTGNKYQLEVDLSPKGLGQLRIQRTYNSYSNPSKPFLQHWVFFYTQRLELLIYGTSTPRSVVAHRPDGSIVYFTQSGSSWPSENDSITKLEEQ